MLSTLKLCGTLPTAEVETSRHPRARYTVLMPREKTLSPDRMAFDLDTATFRELGQQMVELMAEALDAEHRDPVLDRASGEKIQTLFDRDLPRAGRPIEELFAECREALLPYCRSNGHPRFFAYVSSSADPVGILADALTAALNQNVTAWRSSPPAATLERLVVRWLDQMVGFGAGGIGTLTSGGSAANFQALAAAVRLAEEAAELPSGSRHRLTVCLSREAHLSMVKAAQLLGLAEGHIRRIEIDADRRLRLDDLRRQLDDDQRAGLLPAAICASAGTANTGAIDPLDEIADLAAQHQIWLHIDGAYGAPAALTPEYRWMSRAFARADSLSLDPHKWLYAPLDVACVLYRDATAPRRAFDLDSEYIAVSQTDPLESYAFFQNSPELSRRFRALKVWMILETRGVDHLAEEIDRNIALRRRLDDRIATHPRLEPLGSELSISCFRYLPEAPQNTDTVNVLNRRILETLVQSGEFYMSPTTLEGRYALRVCIVNFRTTENDIDRLVDEVLRLGGEFSA